MGVCLAQFTLTPATVMLLDALSPLILHLPFAFSSGVTTVPSIADAFQVSIFLLWAPLQLFLHSGSQLSIGSH